MAFKTLKTEDSVLIAVRVITMLTVSTSETGKDRKYMILGTGVWLNSETI